MTKKILVLGVLIVMGLGLFAGCINPERHNEQLKVSGFHSLEDAYVKGWLSKADLKSIAYYYDGFYNGGRKEKNFVPKPKDPEILCKEIQNKIIKEYISDFMIENPEITFEDIILDLFSISKYYGVYSDCFVLKIEDGTCYDAPAKTRNRRIGGVLFREYWAAREIHVWIAD